MRAAPLLVILTACGGGSAKPDAAPIDGKPCTGVHDDDGDGYTDDCDTCPTVPSAAFGQQDTDGDGIGDVCDPHRASSDHVQLFATFADAGDLARFVAPAAGTLASDALQLTDQAVTTTDSFVWEAVAVAPVVPEGGTLELRVGPMSACRISWGADCAPITAPCLIVDTGTNAGRMHLATPIDVVDVTATRNDGLVHCVARSADGSLLDAQLPTTDGGGSPITLTGSGGVAVSAKSLVVYLGGS